MIAVALALAAAAIPALPAKLVVMTTHGVAITDYASMARCKAARTALLDASIREQNIPLPPKGFHVDSSPQLTVICIPA